MAEKDFISRWVSNLREGALKNFPDDFVNAEEVQKINLPGKALILGTELFGSYEIVDSQGNKIFQAKDIVSAKYVLYSNRNMPLQINIPLNDSEINTSVKSYEKYLDGLVSEIIKDFRNEFPEKKNFFEVTNIIFNSLFLHRY